MSLISYHFSLFSCKLHVYRFYGMQKQPCRYVFRKKCSENTQQIYRRTTMPKCDFNFIKIAFWHGSSPISLLHIFRTPFPRNTFEWLLLKMEFLCRHLWYENTVNLKSIYGLTFFFFFFMVSLVLLFVQIVEFSISIFHVDQKSSWHEKLNQKWWAKYQK